MKKYKVLFCDLDGTLIETLSGETFPLGIWDMRIRFDTLNAIKKLAPKYVFIVSNQGGIENGFVDERDFQFKSEYVRRCLCEYLGIDIEHCDYQYCKRNDKEFPCRKPNTGMLSHCCVNYIEDNDLTKKDALMIGDASGKPGQFSDSDKKTAENFEIDYMDVEDFIEIYQ